MSEKIQKILARNGVGSRREVEDWIRAGRIKIAGQVATLGARITERDQVTLDNRPLLLSAAPPTTQVLMYHKPEGELCTRHDPQGRAIVLQSLPQPREGRWVLVGRLDLNTAGLLLVTTAGELAHRLMHPSYQIEREYAVRVLGNASDAQLQRLQTGIPLEGVEARFTHVEKMHGEGANCWYRVIILEGRQREVRRLWEAVGLTVSRLIRIRFGPIQLPRNLDKGQYRDLSTAEIALLKQAVSLE